MDCEKMLKSATWISIGLSIYSIMRFFIQPELYLMDFFLSLILLITGILIFSIKILNGRKTLVIIQLIILGIYIYFAIILMLYYFIFGILELLFCVPQFVLFCCYLSCVKQDKRAIPPKPIFGKIENNNDKETKHRVYINAKKLYKEMQYDEALEQFERVCDYEDAVKYIDIIKAKEFE